MTIQCVIAEFQDLKTAKLGLEILEKAGFDHNHISVITRRDDPELEGLEGLGDGEDAEGDELPASARAGLGGVLGGSLAVPLAASTLIGPFMLVGPIVGMGVGAAVGALGGTSAWGVDEQDQADYQSKVENGSILIIVSGDRGDLLEAEASLKTAGPESIRRFEHS